MKRKILLLEINEIPWRVIDKFINNPRFPNIKRFFSSSKTYTTFIPPSKMSQDESHLVRGTSKEGNPVTIDSGELSPWITWPTFHRGISTNEHNIKFLGQDTGTFKGKPIWKEFRDRNLNVGICGSLQSWPPINPGNNGFYIPDTFAHDEKCFPQYIEPFQKFNLEQVKENGLVIRQNKLFSKNLSSFLLSIPRLGITTGSLFKTLNQLVLEKVDKNYLPGRTTFQCILLWDIFKSLYKINNPPSFSTFFTNHFASLMHRYWNYIFPEDFSKNTAEKKAISNSVLFGFKVIDKILGEAMAFTEVNPEITLVFATSMGQDAINYIYYENYSAELENVTKLLNIFDIQKQDYNPLLAMVPQFTLEVANESVRKKIHTEINKCHSQSGKQLFSIESEGKTVCITIHTPPAQDIENSGLVYKGNNSSVKNFKWENVGIKMHKLDVATAYHIPEGIMAIYGNGIAPNSSREKFELTQCKSLLLDLAGL